MLWKSFSKFSSIRRASASSSELQVETSAIITISLANHELVYMEVGGQRFTASVLREQQFGGEKSTLLAFCASEETLTSVPLP